MSVSSIIENCVRFVFWFICKFIFSLMDLMYNVINQLAVIKISDFGFVWTWWGGLLVLLSAFVFVRIWIMFIKSTMDEDYLYKVDPLVVLKRLGGAAVAVVFLPLVLNFLSASTATFVENIPLIFTGNATINTPSEIIVSAGYSDDIADFDYNKIDINKKENGEYIYFPNSFDICFALAAGVVAAVIFVFIGVQIGQRIFGLILKILISPYAISGLVDPSDNTFGTWGKLCISDFLTAFFQMVLVLAALTMVTLVPLQPIAKIIFFIGCLMGVMVAPSGIGQLLGGDVGVFSSMQQMQSMTALSSGLNMAGGIMATGGAAALYGAGRIAGGKSLLNGTNRMGVGFGMGLGSSGGVNSATNASSTGGSSEEGINYEPNFNSGLGSNDFSVPNTVSDSSIRLTREGKLARTVADTFSTTASGRISNTVGASLYQKSARRLSRNINTRQGVKQSKFVGASHLVHDVKDSIKGGNNNDV